MLFIHQLLLPLTEYRYLWRQLTQRDIKARYKQSIIGYAWIILNPLSQILVYTFVFSIVFRFPTDIPYPVFLFAGLLPWIFMQNSVMAATNSLVNSAALLKKVQFPREVIPYAAVGSKLIDLLFSWVIFAVLLMFFGVKLAATSWLILPLLVIQLLLTVGISLIGAAANLFYRDSQYLINLLLLLWLYMSPVVYPVSMVPPQFLWYYKLNPLVGILEGYRSALFNQPFETNIIGWSAGVSIIVFLGGFVLFKRSERYFADIV
ncbi:MAG: phosphate ABC transporter permease [Candidatus Pacebacteria bacterium CG10_big_fil_rev_8_21_14_0_10_56_10]|nr:MAG: phosphate ABC transporter permease [Candidatus Pacebacteria bacterium CG10_big_fil_rev_8_21_14_0_10_56_10]